MPDAGEGDGMNAAMRPGNEIDFEDIYPRVCSKCHWRFISYPIDNPRIDAEWCDSCNRDPLSDRSEDATWASTRSKPFVFMGWSFLEKQIPETPGEIGLMLYKKLPYPENPDAFLSYSKGSVKERMAAWLIAHWFEHLLQICPCRDGKRDKAVDEGEGSNFRKAVINSLIWYHERGLS
jgi:hypothetical protein